MTTRRASTVTAKGFLAEPHTLGSLFTHFVHFSHHLLHFSHHLVHFTHHLVHLHTTSCCTSFFTHWPLPPLGSTRLPALALMNTLQLFRHFSPSCTCDSSLEHLMAGTHTTELLSSKSIYETLSSRHAGPAAPTQHRHPSLLSLEPTLPYLNQINLLLKGKPSKNHFQPRIRQASVFQRNRSSPSRMQPTNFRPHHWRLPRRMISRERERDCPVPEGTASRQPSNLSSKHGVWSGETLQRGSNRAVTGTKPSCAQPPL